MSNHFIEPVKLADKYKLTNLNDPGLIPQLIKGPAQSIVEQIEGDVTKYIQTTLVSLNIDQDILERQTAEIYRLNGLLNDLKGDLIRRSDVIDILRKNASNDIQDQVLTENNINLVNSIPAVVDLDRSKIKFWLDGCDISFVAEAPRDITLEQLLKQCNRIVPAWCTCGIRSAEEREETEIIIDYNNIRKVDDDVNCTIKEV